MTDRKVMQQALEALEYMHQEKCDYMRRNNLGDPLREDAARIALPAIAALRARLAELEPVANGWTLREVLFEDGEPIAHREPTPRRPLTDDEISAAWAEVMLFPQRNKTHMDLARSFARAIERALKETK